MLLKDKVCVVWHPKGSDQVSTLGYGNGLIRTYKPGKVDPRAGNPKQIHTRKELLLHFGKTEDLCVITVDLAQDVFEWPDSDFSD